MDHQSKPKSLVLLAEFQTYLDRVAFYFTGANIHLGQRNKRGGIVSVLTNWKLVYAICVFVSLSYLIATQNSTVDVIVLQIWTTAAVFQLITRGINGVFHVQHMNDLIQWYKTMYQPVANSKHQAVYDDCLERQNYFIAIVMKTLPNVTLVAAILYTGQPILTRTKTLPTPIEWQGQSEADFSIPLYLFLYVALVYSTVNVVLMIMATDCFFAITAIILGTRFRTIALLLQALNYSGPRNRQKDREIIQQCYLMHLEVMEKVDKFLKYFNIYGLFHFMSPILVNTVLSYFMHKTGFNLMSVSVIVAMSSQIAVVCFFGQVVTDRANAFSLSIYELDWYDLEVSEKKMLLLMYIRSQETVSVKAGYLYELNFPIMTQVVKFQASFYAVLKTL